MGKPLILLGAGASIDAGLPDAFQLTRLVYDQLRHTPRSSEAHLYGYVLTKLLERNVRQGGSPFDQVNIEDVYDGLQRLLYRDKDLISDFVYSWDPILDTLKPPFNERAFARYLAESLTTRRSLTGGLSFDSWKLGKAAHEVSKALNASFSSEKAQYLLEPFLEALVGCLSASLKGLDYAHQLVRFARDEGASIATLNYDRVVEDACTEQGLSIDYGLNAWDQRKIIKWSGGGVRLLKLHGSINWYGDYDHIAFERQEGRRKPSSVMIFGGQNGKLIPDGPFLQLRHEFETALRQTNVLLVIGYSFRDDHLNAIIRRWVSTRRLAKLIVVDPGTPPLTVETIGYPYTTKDGRVTRVTVEIEHIKEGAAVGMARAIASCKKPPAPIQPAIKTAAATRLAKLNKRPEAKKPFR